jgi:subfamily B ATP-binding cassette protein MsbA
LNAPKGTYSRMLEFAKPYVVQLTGSVICLALAAGLETYVMYMAKTLLDEGVLNKDNVAGKAVLLSASLAIMGLVTLKGFFSYFGETLNNGVASRIGMTVRQKLFEKLTLMPLSYHSHQRAGQMSSLLTYDATNMQAGISDVIGRVVGSALKIAGLMGLVFYLNWRLAFQVLVVFPIAMGPLYYFGRKIRRYASRDQERMADLASLSQEILSGIRVVMAFTRESYEQGRFNAAVLSHFKAIMQKLRMSALSSPVMEAIGGIGIALMMYMVGRQVLDGHMTFGAVASLGAALASLYPCFKALNGVNITIQGAIAAGERVFRVLDEPVIIKDKPAAMGLRPPKEAIAFDHVGFAYDGGQAVLKDISFEIKVGHRVALVGPSGAGKTTLVDLLPRFQDAGSGVITWDGVDVRDATLQSLRGHIGVVTQETFLFNDTIEANIAYGRPGATREAIESAAKAANAHAFILEQAKGYETLIGERGVRLSGGQRQRLAIARAILKNPPVLILDEATSALDTQSEQLVQEALDRLMERRTTLVIAHRLSTVQHADEILVLDQGRITERGKHEALLETGGLYAKLYKLQFGKKSAPKNKAVFLDRDGTVSVEMGYIHEKDLGRYALESGATEGMKLLAEAGYKLVLVTNQSGVARGYYPESTVAAVHARLGALLAEKGVALDAIYYCPHHPDPLGPNDTGDTDTAGRVDAKPLMELALDCDCRKPKAGMGLKAALELNLDLSQCWMIGDKNADLGFAANLGVKPVLVLTGYGRDTLAKVSRPDFVAADLVAAAKIILELP